jgi:hypothetical protein
MGIMKRLNVEHRLLLTAGALVFLLLLGSAGDAFSQEPTIGEKIAQAYGVSGFGQVEEIKFTFNVKKVDIAATRSWIWQPKEDRVTFLGDGKTDMAISYNRKDISDKSSESLRQIDAHFINDQYWLLFPFHLVWDSGMKVELAGDNVKFPMGDRTGRMVSVIYPPTGGYTPGDRYDLFLDDNNMIAEWIYRRGGAEKPTVTATWQDNHHMGPIIMSLNHVGADNNFRVWFTDVEMKLSGSNELIKAE